jgi:leader peptidase (prepilin peptidase)/N-methyltransferase
LNPDFLEVFVPAAAFCFGATIGSFLNVVIYRLPRMNLAPEELEELKRRGEDVPLPEGLSVAYPRRSFCPKCREQIAGYDNIPLVSYFVLAGKCRKCRSPIPLRYFGVELLTATLFAVSFARFAPDLALSAVYALLAAAFVAITFIDIDFQIIPDRIDIPGMIIAPVISFLVPQIHRHGRAGTFDDLATLGITLENPAVAALASSVLGIVAGAGIIRLIGILGKLAFRKEAMGYGDVKLYGMIGGFIGWMGVLIGLMVACIAGSVIGIAIKVSARIRGAEDDSYIPFGPFLALGALAMIFFRSEILFFLTVTWPNLLQGQG